MTLVITGLAPVISMRKAPCSTDRDGRATPDQVRGRRPAMTAASVVVLGPGSSPSAPAGMTGEGLGYDLRFDRHRPPHPRPARLAEPLLRHLRQGTDPAAPRPHHLRDDDLHPADPAPAVRLRHQRRSEAPADSRSGAG